MHPFDAHLLTRTETRRVQRRIHRVHRSQVIQDPLRHRGVVMGGHRLAGLEPPHHLLDIPGGDRALSLQAPLGAEQPPLVVRGRQIISRVHLLAGRPSPGPSAQALEAHQHLDREHPRLPALVVGQLAARLDDRAKPVHPAHVVRAVHLAAHRIRSVLTVA